MTRDKVVFKAGRANSAPLLGTWGRSGNFFMTWAGGRAPRKFKFSDFRFLCIFLTQVEAGEKGSLVYRGLYIFERYFIQSSRGFKGAATATGSDWQTVAVPLAVA